MQTLHPSQRISQNQGSISPQLALSSDYDARANNFSYICCNPIASLSISGEKIAYTFPDGSHQEKSLTAADQVPQLVQDFAQQFESKKYPFKFITNGLFGFIAHEAVAHFEHLTLRNDKDNLEVPEIYYAVYQNIIAISLFNHEAHLLSHSYDGSNNLDQIEKILKKDNATTYQFKKQGEKSSNLTDEEFTILVNKAKEHCFRGDVFQLVLSRRFSQGFSGDEFNVYRTLRSINPSPYLFFFDYGDFKIFGSSPEAQLVVEQGKAEIHPIAGTFKRTGNDKEDWASAERLAADPKENSEHVMLVDLARNDLSRNGTEVVVEKNREIQFFSHVIHLVSKVTAHLKSQAKTFQVVADTFPAGTLSGAPKHMALQLIDRYENTARNAYGGALGYMDFQGNFNHCIIIRYFMSKNQQLYYQAGQASFQICTGKRITRGLQQTRGLGQSPNTGRKIISMKKIFVIDNYDSFTYNLVHYLEELGAEVTVRRNDQFDLSEPKAYEYLLLSPGPGIPDEAGLLKATIEKYASTKKILGVCLGQQAIGEVFGASLVNLDTVFHGVATPVRVAEDDLLFKDLPQNFEVGRYHSWVVQTPLPQDLVATSFDDNQQLMSLRHKSLSVRAVQFHPESILTPHGKKILENWINS